MEGEPGGAAAEPLRLSLVQIARALACALALLLPQATDAVLIASGDGTGNNTSPGFFGWDYVGEVNGLSATYLGEGWVITADHVGSGDFTLDGIVYPLVPGSEHWLENEGVSTLPDLVMFAVSPRPDLDPLPLRADKPPVGEFTIMIGCGRDRGPATVFDPNGPFPPEELSGWEWETSSSKRWGTNEVEGFPVGLVGGTVAFYTSFDDGELFPEGQGTAGDSGGAVFTSGVGGTELAGILYAVGPSPGQPRATSLFTNLTFAARIDFYYDQIQDVIALPEPTGGLGWGVALLVVLARRRARLAAPWGPPRA